MHKAVSAGFIGTMTLLGIQAAQAQAPAAPPPLATILEQSSEYRFQLDLHVSDAALARMLPAGWETAMAAQGPAKDANLRLIFVDAVNIVGPDNKPLGKGAGSIAMLAAPVKKSDGSATGQMILGGISETGNDPDAYGVYLKAATAKLTRRKVPPVSFSRMAAALPMNFETFSSSLSIPRKLKFTSVATRKPI